MENFSYRSSSRLSHSPTRSFRSFGLLFPFSFWTISETFGGREGGDRLAYAKSRKIWNPNFRPSSTRAQGHLEETGTNLYEISDLTSRHRTFFRQKNLSEVKSLLVLVTRLVSIFFALRLNWGVPCHPRSRSHLLRETFVHPLELLKLEFETLIGSDGRVSTGLFSAWKLFSWTLLNSAILLHFLRGFFPPTKLKKVR